MKLTKELEERLKKEALKHLSKGRKDWDVPHTLNAVNWMRKLIEKEGGDEKVLVTAMYLHDIGYPVVEDLNKDRLKRIKELKRFHAVEGARKAEVILKKLGDYSKPEIKEIIYLVKHHDDLEIKSRNHQLVFEADNLSKIDVEAVTPTLSEEVYPLFLNHYKEFRAPLFKTETGKRFLNELLPKAEKYFN
ncbi:HD domain-containing protein|nr:HD domain-containing protein [archaeon]